MGIISTEMQQAVLISSLCLILVAFSRVVGETQKACTQLNCGGDHGPAIRFPFRHKDRHPDHCGYPGFVVSCNERHETVLELPIPVKFSVNTIDYKNQKIYLDYPHRELAKLLETHNMSFFPFYVTYPWNFTLFDCSLGLEESGFAFPAAAVPCLSSPGHHIYAVDPSDNVEGLQYCNKTSNVLSVPNIFGGAVTILVVTGASLGSFVLMLLVIAAYHVYSYDRNEKENRLKIERFLEDYKALKPSRYSYADIKRITHQFKDKLGEGAYGTVYKGKLSSEFFVAVKVLNSSTGDRWGRRALVYEFLPNGSLQDFISSANNNNSFLGWDKLQDIALGVAQGIEYLHQGCDQRILHFDIKPHNVLLDHNFTAKLSDFSLAKLCSKDQSLVSMTTARGTMGYIAPEVFSRNFGKRTNEAYYPEVIYNLLEEGEDPRIHIGEGDGKIPTKLATVGLWCVQWNPVDRPSMKTVVEMLEGGENLTKPPNPFASTGSTRIFATGPSRNLNLELEIIVELE
ncbi:PREDICTED: rust resistance kinase Lr10 [Prunus dulcis]|uniref:non-specific serine/threonine protein kinase n=1 Tax=Prunus dulcis TaxID=3755 RepID=A0A5E4GEY6_PRUDU|nr:hypothetical protein L3X38_012116 [Prunus dulcis]VVA38088.1 PREDICTED: rust resistance kinase Lr10 [Prunus dulcis]